jgi:hypothetical protein
MPKYNVEISRTEVKVHTFEGIDADDENAAEMKAREETSPNFDWNNVSASSVEEGTELVEEVE